LRNIVHTSIGGTSARVRISNTFGGGALQIRDVHVAVRTTGSSIDVATDKALTFNGQPEVTVPARMFAESDGVVFEVKPLSDVAISFFVVASSGGTCHAAAWQTNYSVAGNMVSAATMAGAQTSASWSYVLNLDVLNPAAEGSVVTLGASITDGFYAGTDVNKRWPNFLAARIVMANRVIGVLNQGISADGVGGAVGRFDRDVLSQPNVKWVIFSDNPINDFGRSRPSAESELTQIKGMMAKAKAKGVKFLCSTMTPYAGAEPGRTQLNALLRAADSGCDGIVPMDMATSDPANPMRWSAAANSPDGLHPGPSGMEMMAGAVDLALFK
jgi:lysophospholipase L1-like esterase